LISERLTVEEIARFNAQLNNWLESDKRFAVMYIPGGDLTVIKTPGGVDWRWSPKHGETRPGT
jgi:hypothetical protein